MASEYVQTKINYGFADIELLHSALKAADRSDEDGSSSDGNRGLARIGLSVMDMVETHNIIIVENGTKSRSHDSLLHRHTSQLYRRRKRP